MILKQIGGTLECLKLAGIKHDVFISREKCELQLWDDKKFHQTLELLKKYGVTPDTIFKRKDFYIIYF